MVEEDELRRFLQLHIPSLWALEFFLTLWREPARRWKPRELVTELRASISLVSKNIAWLERQDLITECDEGWSAIVDPAVRNIVAKLDQLYRERPMFVTEIITGEGDQLQGALARGFRSSEER